jgi:hypothetical protein
LKRGILLKINLADKGMNYLLENFNGNIKYSFLKFENGGKGAKIRIKPIGFAHGFRQGILKWEVSLYH